MIICSGLSCGILGVICPTFYFPTSKVKLEKAFSRMYIQNPGYDNPDSLKKYDDWPKRGYSFLENKVLYFDTPPKELYYITYIGDSIDLLDSTKIGIAIRAVCIPEKSSKWLLGEELRDAEKNRMTERFNTETIPG